MGILEGVASVPAPALTNVRIVTLLAASLLAGYAGDEAISAWWQPGKPVTESAKMTSKEDLSLAAGKLIAN